MFHQVSVPLVQVLRLPTTGSPSPARTLICVSNAIDQRGIRSALAGILRASRKRVVLH